jgi:4-hydroxybenzoate polyprenyltransferase
MNLTPAETSNDAGIDMSPADRPHPMTMSIRRTGGWKDIFDLNILQIFLRCGSCRFAAYYFLSFQIAIVDGKQESWSWAAFGAAFWLLHSLGIELLNRYSDRVEDRISRADRTALCEAIGYRSIMGAAIAIWMMIGATFVGWLYLFPNPVLAALLWAGLAVGVFYSVLFRFKARRYLSVLVLTFPFGGSFLIGWAATHGDLQPAELFYDLFVRLGPFLLVAGLFFIGHVGIKDITDIAGDERIGYRSVWVSLVRSRANLTIRALVSLWCFACVSFVATGALPPRFIFLTLLWPLSLIFATAASRASARADREAVRELFYHYWFFFLSVLLYSLVPGVPALMSIAGTAVYWILTSQYLHWTDGITVDGIRRVASLVRSPAASVRTR